jgi:hypothetical protein
MNKPESASPINLLYFLFLFIIIWCLVYSCQRTQENEINKEKALVEAIQDSLHVYKEKNGQLVVQKKTLIGTLKDIKEQNEFLNAEQKDLIEKLNKLQTKTHRSVGGMLVKQEIKVDSLKLITSLNKTDSASFVSQYTSDSISMVIDIKGVKPTTDSIPSVSLRNLTIPGELFVEFGYDPTNPNHVISVTARSTNPLLRAQKIETQLIPEIITNQERTTLGKKIMLVGYGIIGGFIIGTVITR